MMAAPPVIHNQAQAFAYLGQALQHINANQNQTSGKIVAVRRGGCWGVGARACVFKWVCK